MKVLFRPADGNPSLSSPPLPFPTSSAFVAVKRGTIDNELNLATLEPSVWDMNVLFPPPPLHKSITTRVNRSDRAHERMCSECTETLANWKQYSTLNRLGIRRYPSAEPAITPPSVSFRGVLSVWNCLRMMTETHPPPPPKKKPHIPPCKWTY